MSIRPFSLPHLFPHMHTPREASYSFCCEFRAILANHLTFSVTAEVSSRNHVCVFCIGMFLTRFESLVSNWVFFNRFQNKCGLNDGPKNAPWFTGYLKFKGTILLTPFYVFSWRHGYCNANRQSDCSTYHHLSWFARK